ncbi:hypothetical protein EON62_03840 [archaeon]|nr:MAG: hypothetical protein EON62_03840 [archaeon]
MFPQFDEVGAHGAHKQQDAEEFFSTLMNGLSTELKTTGSGASAVAGSPTSASNVIDSLFGVNMSVTYVPPHAAWGASVHEYAQPWCRCTCVCVLSSVHVLCTCVQHDLQGDGRRAARGADGIPPQADLQH